MPSGRERDAALERYLRREGERPRFVTRRHAASRLGLLAVPACCAMDARGLYRIMSFFAVGSPPRVAA
jgi:hypothetical protein